MKMPKRNLPDDQRMIFVPHNFRHLPLSAIIQGRAKVDGILADLGVSSHQFDEAERGFSTRFDAAWICGWIQRQPLTAAEVCQDLSVSRNCIRCLNDMAK